MTANPDPFVLGLSEAKLGRRPSDQLARPLVVRQAHHEPKLGEFSLGATRLAGLVPRLLGWRPGDFWDATPAELAAILASFEPAGVPPLGRSEFDQLLERERHG